MAITIFKHSLTTGNAKFTGGKHVYACEYRLKILVGAFFGY